MADFNITISNRVTPLGPAQPSLWGTMIWGTDQWGYSSDMQTNTGKHLFESLSLVDLFLKNGVKLLSNSLSMLHTSTSTTHKDVNNYIYQNENLTTYTETTEYSTTWNGATEHSSSWTVVTEH